MASSAVPPTLLSAAEEAALLQSTSAQLDQLARDVVADWWSLQDELLLRFGDGYEFAWGAEGAWTGKPLQYPVEWLESVSSWTPAEEVECPRARRLRLRSRKREP